MTDPQEKFDPFKPAQPRIPGVSGAPATPSSESAVQRAAPSSKLTPQQMAIGAAAAVVLGIILIAILLRPSAPAAAPETPAPAATSVPEPAAAASSSPKAAIAAVSPIYPDEVTTAEEMEKPWSFKRFTFLKNLPLGPVPAMLVRLPGGSVRSANSYWAFALKSRYGKCDLELVTDLEKLRNDYGYRAQHPMVVEPCSSTVFDPLQQATVSGAWVRGQVVQGAGLRPPLMIQVQIRGNRVLAVQME